MSFSVTLQTNRNDSYVLDKNLINIMTVDGVLREQSSIIDPVIRFELDLPDLVHCNYCTIPTFGRSYFVNDIISVRTKIVELHCHVDVLTSFKTEIRNCTGIVYRQANQWNLYMNDGLFRVNQNPQITTKAFPNGFTTQSYILAVSGS